MTPDDATTSTEETSAEEAVSEETLPDENESAAEEDDEGVEAEGTLLEQSQATIDDAHEAVKRVERTDAIGDDTIGIAVTDDEAAADRTTED